MHKTDVKFLHLSDVHFGMPAQGWLMPSFETAFLDDIRKLHKRTGNWDFVIFSGDLTQRAGSTEYAALTGFLKRLWKVFNDLGCQPLLIPVPGNHDLQRPDRLDPTAKAMQGWWTDADVREAFWNKKPRAYWDLIQKVFSNYSDWLTNLPSEIPLPALTKGLFPGDISARIRLPDYNIGVIGLNSAWLQLGGGDYTGKLHVDIRQLLSVTNNNPDEWCQSNDANFVVTHHPLAWLHASSHREWKSDIDCHGRFDAHLFGHMHEPLTTSLSAGGSRARNSIQSASLFGLEEIESSGETRIHGYSAVGLAIVASQKSIRLWPRTSVTAKSGSRKLIADYEFELDDDESFFLSGTQLSSASEIVPTAAEEVVSFNVNFGNELEVLRKLLPAAGAHTHVRTVEQEAALIQLNERRAFWLLSDWGSGDQEFLRAVIHRLDAEPTVFEIDCQNYYSRHQFLSGIKASYGISFEKICEILSSLPESLLILSDLQTIDPKTGDATAIQDEIDSVIAATLDFCKSTRVVVQGRKQPIKTGYRCIRLAALDQADTAAYLRYHEKAARLHLTSQLVAQIFQHTDGVPSRIDSILIDANIVGVRELHTLNSDVVSSAVSLDQVPAALVTTVSELEGSQDPSLKRAFELLKALAVFPKGERLDTLKRFHQKYVFYTPDVHILVERALIDVVEVPSFSNFKSGDQGAVLVVKRPVREYLHAKMQAREIAALNRKALGIYFGNDWQLRGIRAAKGPNFERRNCGTWQITNAAMMVLRLTKEAVERDSEERIKSAISLATSFYAALIAGDHYSNIVTSSEELIPLFESCSSSALDLVLIRAQRARSLRMTTEVEQARNAFLEIKDQDAPKALRLQILVGLALAHKGLGEIEESVAVARECVRLDPRSNSALQARSIVAEAEEDPIVREAELARIEASARRKNAFIVANNIALDRAIENKNVEVLKDLTQKLYKQARSDGDHHNSMRAILRFAEASINTGGTLSGPQLDMIFEIYHYLYGESFIRLFNSCHDILWSHFYKTKQLENLLRLFRLSSVSWRLRGEERMERKYLTEAKKLIKHEFTDQGGASSSAAYFFSRSAFLLK